MVFKCLRFSEHEAEYKRKIDECKQNTKKEKFEAPTNAEIELLQKKPQTEHETEHLLKKDLR